MARVPLPPPVARWRAAGELLTLGGRSVFLRDGGSGPPLLLLHAYPTASWGFHRVWDELTKTFRVLALDLPGSGFSQKGRNADYSLAGLAAVVEALLRRCAVERPHLLAHGYGGSVAQELMAGGRSFASACFVTAGLFPAVGHITWMQRLMLSPLGPLVARVPQPFAVFSRSLSKAFGPETQPTQEDLQAIWALLCFNEGQRSVPQVIGYLSERKRLAARLVAALVQADCPMTLLASAEDALGGRPVIEAWRRSLPRAGLALLPAGTGHYAPLECPAALLEIYRAFHRDLPT